MLISIFNCILSSSYLNANLPTSKSKSWVKLIHKLVEAYSAVPIFIHFLHQTDELPLSGEETVIGQILSQIFQGKETIDVSVDVRKCMFDIEIRSVSEADSEDLASSLSCEHLAPQGSQLISGITVEEL